MILIFGEQRDTSVGLSRKHHAEYKDKHNICYVFSMDRGNGCKNKTRNIVHEPVPSKVD